MGRDDVWPTYVSIAEKRKKADAKIKKLRKTEKNLNPIIVEGREISHTFWGKAWVRHLEKYSDIANRLPRGRSYLRHHCLVDLQVAPGHVTAQVLGNSLYRVNISVNPLSKDKWNSLIKACLGKIDSIIDLLRGKFSDGVMKVLTEKEQGLFPAPDEISMNCSCPDFAHLCKHVAAVLYGIGASLDNRPEWLFHLRNVDHLELIASAREGDALLLTDTTHQLDDKELSSLFGIEFDAGS